jgi:hypothetical protein
VLKKLALVAALALGSATAHAESITIGYWDQANGLNSPIIPIITMPSFVYAQWAELRNDARRPLGAADGGRQL